MANETCKTCRFLKKGDGFLFCPAFPTGIPPLFGSGDYPHIRPFDSQVGTTVYEKGDNFLTATKEGSGQVKAKSKLDRIAKMRKISRQYRG